MPKLLFQFRVFIFSCLAMFMLSNAVYAQVKVSGKIIDAESGDGMPFVNVYIKNTDTGTSTDFDGYYSLTVPENTDSLTVFNLGYEMKSKAIPKGFKEVSLNFQLVTEVASIDEIVVMPTENPAFAIMRNVMKHKEENDIRKLQAYDYEAYNRMEVSIDNISDNLKKRKIYKKISEVYDSAKAVAGEDGQPVIPMFVSESMSNFYHRHAPDKTKEVINSVRVTGVGVEDGTTVSQLLGSSFQDYNFYKNRLSIVQKDVLSPIADGWQSFYEYELVDSTFIGNKWCYKITFKPKQEKDLAFTGYMWIADSSFALKQIDVSLDKKANINFIDKIKIQQESDLINDSLWMPVKTRATIDIEEVSKNAPGLIAKFYSSNKKFNINQPQDDKFYDQLIEVKEDANMKDKAYWDASRHDSITDSERNMYAMIDTIKNVPIVKSYVEIANILFNGYKKVGKIDVGPYLLMYAYNAVEGNRFRLGFKTNIDFSKRWVVKGYAAYGTLDTKFKYSGSVDYIFSKKRWTQAGIKYRYDLNMISVNEERLTNNAIFLMYLHWGSLNGRGPYYSEFKQIYFQTELKKDLGVKVRLRNWDFNPTYAFNYYPGVEVGDTSYTSSYFKTTEVITDIRFTKDEILIQNDNERISLGTKGWPIFHIQYTYGIPGLMASNFEYHKINLFVDQSFKVGALGRSYYNLTTGKIFTPLPYPLLEVHMGNQSYFYTTATFNLMNYFEFVSDQFVSINYRHHFEGLFFNRVPLMKKLNWRFLVSYNAVYGSLSNANIAYIPYADRKNATVKSFGDMPYMEAGYGIENIFRFLRVDFIHRLTYTDNASAHNFGVKFSAQFKF
jgi:hypothetical protein